MPKITALTAYSTPQATDVLPIVDISGPTTKKITWANLFKAPAISGNPTFTGVLTDTQSIAAVSTDGLVLQNTTAAAAGAGAQQWSPRLHLIGQGWKTTATAGSQTVDWIAEVQPVQGLANPTSVLQFSYQVNGAGYTAGPGFNSAGQVLVADGSLSLPTLGFASHPNDGMYLVSGGGPAITSGGVFAAAFGNGDASSIAVLAGATNGIGFTTAATSNSRAFITNPAAATLQLGSADAASPVAQSLRVQSVATGTSNGAGTLWKFIDSTGTGTGVSGGFEFDVHPASTTGSTQNAAVSALAIDSTKLATFGGDYKTTNFTNAGSTGSVTINSRVGSVQLAAAQTSLTVTNSTVTATSIIVCSMLSADTTAKSAACVPGSGSFVVTANAAATSTTVIAFHVLT